MNEKIMGGAEKIRVNPDEVRRRFTEIPNTPGSIRKVLGGKNALRLMQILTSDQAIEADWLFECDEITDEQREQYLDATGDRAACTGALVQLASEIAQEIKPRLPTLVAREGRGEKKETVTEIINAALYLCDAKTEPFKGTSSAVTNFAFEFLMNLFAFIGADLIELLGNDAVNVSVQDEAQKIIYRYRDWSKRDLGVDFQGYQFYQEHFFYEVTLSDEENLETLDTIINFSENFTEEEHNALVKEKDDLLEYVKKEALYKKIPLVTLSEKNPQVILQRDDEGGEQYGDILGVAILNFVHGEPVEFPGFLKDVHGNVYCDFGIRDNIVCLHINPTKGDLNFITGGVPVRDLVGKDRYVALQVYLLKGLRSYLDSKEPDIEDFFFDVSTQENLEQSGVSPDEPIQEQSEIDDTQKMVIPDISEEVSPVWKYVPQSDQAEIEDTPSLAGGENISKHVRGLIMNKISGARAEEILDALRKMLGQEVRIVGSHHVFKSERTGKTMPIPRHSQSSKNHISLGLILDNLKVWGYSPLELATELGVKIPEKLLKRGGV